MMDDPAHLLDALAKGDGKAWESFYRSHLLPLRARLARCFDSLSPDEIDDVWAETIEKVCRKIETLREPKALVSWLWRVARCTGLDYVEEKTAQERRQAPLFEEVLSGEDDSPEDLVAGEGDDPLEGLVADDAGMARLREAFEALPPLHRSVLMLRHDGDAPEDVIYCLTGLTPHQQRGVLGNVRSRFRDKSDTFPRN
jgi:RNA polymerase sigma factor (sigma-70 family)